MTFHETNETPLELREIENRLQSLRPTKEPDLVVSLGIYSSVQNEYLPHFAGASSVKNFSRFVRRAQFRAGLFGGLAGTLFGALLGGLCVYCAMLSPEFRQRSCDVLGDVAYTSPIYVVVNVGEGELPTSVRKILGYYDSISAQLDEPGES